MTDYHEPWDALPEDARNVHRALISLKEEIDAVDWYHQRVALTQDDALRAILAHNRDEEVEHACMALEWLRRVRPEWDEHLRTYLFTEKPITEIEEGDEGASSDNGGGRGLGIGRPRGGR